MNKYTGNIIGIYAFGIFEHRCSIGTKNTFKKNRYAWLRIVVGFVCIAGFSGCAQTSQKSDAQIYEKRKGSDVIISSSPKSDPLAWFNRPVFAFNDTFYRFLLSPTAKAYKKTVPTQVNHAIGNFFSNLEEPVNAINNLLQGKPETSGKNLLRFTVNSTAGILGLWDASDALLGIDDHDASFNETLVTWGVPAGPYLVMPILGPSDLRGAPSSFIDRMVHPVHVSASSNQSLAYSVAEGFHNRIPTLDAYPELVSELEDPYTYIRTLHQQQTERDEQFITKKR